MKAQMKIWPKANNKARPIDRNPDQAKCRNEQSRDLPGATQGDRGMCEKASDVQGSE
jgi:hypothetical protein